MNTTHGHHADGTPQDTHVYNILCRVTGPIGDIGAFEHFGTITPPPGATTMDTIPLVIEALTHSNPHLKGNYSHVVRFTLTPNRLDSTPPPAPRADTPTDPAPPLRPADGPGAELTEANGVVTRTYQLKDTVPPLARMNAVIVPDVVTLSLHDHVDGWNVVFAQVFGLLLEKDGTPGTRRATVQFLDPLDDDAPEWLRHLIHSKITNIRPATTD